MKKVFLVCILSVMTFAAKAQNIDLGIKAGVNFATISDVTDAESKTGFVVGAFAGFKLGEKFGVQADLLYSQQGAKFDAGDIDLSYVNVPVVAKYFVTDKFNIQLGPQFGFVVDDNISKVLGDIAEAEKTDVTGVVGVGLHLPFGLRADARYNFGLTDILKSNNSDVNITEPGKNSVITIALGYSFL